MLSNNIEMKRKLNRNKSRKIRILTKKQKEIRQRARLFAELPQVDAPPTRQREHFDTLFIKAKETKNKKFDLLKVDFQFKNPSSDINVVKNQIQSFLDKKFGTVKGRRINIMLGFDEISNKYRTGEFVANASSDISFKLDEPLSRWEFQQAGYEEKKRYKATSAQVFITMNGGGCFDNTVFISGFSTAKLMNKLFTPLNKKDNNCAIYCLLYFSLSKDTPTGRVGKIKEIKNDFEQCKQIRQKLFNHNELIVTGDLFILGNHFETNIQVYSLVDNKIQSVYEFNQDYKRTCNLLLHNNHYFLITNPTLMDYEKCTTCNHFFADLKSHFADCNRCKKCGQNYTTKEGHSKEQCEFHKNNFIKSGEKAFGITKVDKELKCLTNIIYCDFETLVGNNNDLQVYASALAVDDSPVTIYKGKDSLTNFMNQILKLKKNKKYSLVFYNGSRFDLYFVYKWLVENKIAVEDLIFSDGAYKKFKFGNITTFDLNLHIPGSLKNNCKAFGVDTSKCKGDFDHKLMIDWSCVDKYEHQWRPYLELDIVSLREMYKKYATSVFTDFNLNCIDYMTLSSLAFKYWRTTIDEKVHLLPYNEDKWMRKSIYGGRCYPIKRYFVSSQYEDAKEGKIKYEDINDYLADADVVSLYPTAMAKTDKDKTFLKDHNIGEYPVGDYTVDENQLRLDFIKNELNKGVFKKPYFVIEADIIPNKELVNAVLPRRDETGNLHWDLFDIKRGVYNSVDIRRALLMGYKVEKIYRCLYWEKSKRIFEQYINLVFEMKKKAQKDTPQYTVAKLMMNALYGKMLQAPVVEKNKVISELSELNKLREENQIMSYHFIDDEHLFVSYEPFELDEEVNKPSYLGSFILGYSRGVMDKYINAIDGYKNIETTFFRTDTDSLIIHSRELEKVKPYLGKQLGELDFDINGKILRFSELNPKTYICDYITPQGEMKSHIRAKGIGKSEQEHLTFEDFERMLFNSKQDDEMLELKDSYGNKRGIMTKENDKIKVSLTDKLKRVSFNVNSKQQNKGWSFSQIVSIDFERTLNKTKWMKRNEIPNHPNLASYPIGYSK